jgi:broad specificity phosphatase PhoE
VECSDLLVERRRPSEQLGLPKDDPEALRIGQVMKDNFHVAGFRFSDEENFEDLKARAERTLACLQQRPEDNVLVVTHGYFMRFLLAYALCGRALTAHTARVFADGFHMENTGITILCFDEKNKYSKWWLWVWNDHAHLG